MTLRVGVLGLAVLTLGVGTAVAEDLPGDPLVGREIAESWCGECHNVAPDGADVYESAAAFATLANDPAFTEMALRTFLQTPHGDMPDVMPTRAETDHIIAYILSLRSK